MPLVAASACPGKQRRDLALAIEAAPRGPLRRLCSEEGSRIGSAGIECERGATSTGVVYESPTFVVIEEMEAVTA